MPGKVIKRRRKSLEEKRKHMKENDGKKRYEKCDIWEDHGWLGKT